MQDLGTLPGDNSSAGVAVNSCSQVVGNSVLTAGGNLHAFLWTNAAGLTNLGVLPGFTDAGVHAINNLGQVAGYCAVAGAQNRGFTWTSASGMQALRLLPGGLAATALGINDLGEIVGSADSGESPNLTAFCGTTRDSLWIWEFCLAEAGAPHSASMSSGQLWVTPTGVGRDPMLSCGLRPNPSSRPNPFADRKTVVGWP